MEVYHQRTGLLVLILACLFSVLQISRAFVPVSTRVIPVSDTSRSSRPSCSYVGAQSPSTHIEPVTTLEEFEKALEASASTEQVLKLDCKGVFLWKNLLVSISRVALSKKIGVVDLQLS